MSYHFVFPKHGHSTIAEIMPSIAANLVPKLGIEPILPIPRANRYVLVMVDGLGLELLKLHSDRVPYLGSLLSTSIALTSAIPSTTATSLTTLGTGLTPGQHGIAGYTFNENGKVVNALQWNCEQTPEQAQPNPTWFEKLTQQQITASSVAPAHFANSGLTRAGLRGAKFIGIPPNTARSKRIELVAKATKEAEKTFVYHYERELDHTGHSFGCGSIQWRQTLDEIDEYLEDLRFSLDDDVCLLITGDHGMVDVPEANQLILEDLPGLTTSLELFAGEGRLRQLYTSRPEEVAKRWAKVLGDRALVITRRQAVEDGWFGLVNPNVLGRFGDVLVAMRDDWALMSAALPNEMTLVGQHGSLSAAEMRVPLLADCANYLS